MPHTTDELLVAVREDARVKDSSPSDAEVLRLANRVVQGIFVPMLHSVHQGYGVTTHETAITTSTVEVTLPARAFMSQAIDVRWRPEGGQYEQSLPRLSRDYAEENPYSDFGFSIKDNRLVLHQPEAGTLVVEYAYRPGEMVLLSTVDTLDAAAARGATALTTSGTYTSWAPGDKVDVVSADAPYTVLHQGVVDSYSNPTLTLTAATSLDEEVASGAYVCQAEQTPIVPLPKALFPALSVYVAASVAKRVYEGGSLAASLQQEAELLLQVAEKRLRSRVQDATERYVDWTSPLRLKYRRF